MLYRPMSQNHGVLTQVDLRYWRRFSVAVPDAVSFVTLDPVLHKTSARKRSR